MQEEGKLEMGKMLEDATAAAMTLEAVLEGLEAVVAASEGRSCFGTDTLAEPYTVSLVLKGADGEAKAVMDSKCRVLENQWQEFGRVMHIGVAAPGTEGNPCTNTYRICVDGGTLADVGAEAVVPVLAALIAGCHKGTRIGQDMERDSQRRIGPRYVRSNGCADNISFYGASGIADNISFYGEQIRSSGISCNFGKMDGCHGEQARLSDTSFEE